MCKKTHYQLILDKSGSMDVVRDQTLHGLNQQLKIVRDLKQEFPDQDFHLSLTPFDHTLDFRLDRSTGIQHVFSWNDYVPGGMTALYDAIGESVTRLQRAIQPELDRGHASAVVIILTDGHENSSTKWTHARMQSLIRELQGTNSWVFNYLGATPDAVEIAERLNIRRSNARSFDRDEVKIQSADMAYSARR